VAHTFARLDNVTHSLVGYALGRAFGRSREPQPLGRALVASSVLGSNAPDLDFVVGLAGGDRRLIYLLEHRGFTHTVIFGLALGLALGFACALGWKLRTARDRWLVSAIGAAACLLHVGFDFLNDYGVHPFYPWDNHWYYGDSVFIIEPLLIAVLLPLPFFFAWTRTARVVSGVIAAGLVALVWIVGVSGVTVAVVTAILVAAGALQHRIGPRAWPALVASALVVATFALGARRAEAEVHRLLAASSRIERVLDIATSPAPADPTCYRVMALTLDQDGIYRARLGRVQLFGDAASCKLLPSEPTAPLRAAELVGRGPVRFDAMFEAPARELAQLSAAKCDAEAMLRFIRVPFWAERPDGTVLGDLRYDRGPALEFAERLIRGVCNSGRVPVAPWIPPRADLLQ
jgi:inner membrane protein